MSALKSGVCVVMDPKFSCRKRNKYQNSDVLKSGLSGYHAGLILVAADKFVDFFRSESAVAAAAEPAGFKQSAVAPLPDCIGVYVQKVSHL
jgi:hypothetical protein